MGVTIDLSGKVILVTGGTAGIGRGIVEGMLGAGAKVAFCAPDAAQCQSAARELGDQFGSERVFGVAADLRERDSLVSFVERTTARWCQVDTLICNAAVFGEHSTLEDVHCEQFAEVLESNVVNNFFLCRLVLTQMEKRGAGSIILVTSIAGHVAMPTNIAYSSSKAALASMARSLAAQYASRGIRINCVSPGLIRSEASRDIWEKPNFLRDYTRDKIPMQRIGEPNEIADTCVFLSSPFASYITGATIPVDGGRLGIGQSAGSSAQVRRAETTGTLPG